jgi:peptide/nickel transport system permease protein
MRYAAQRLLSMIGIIVGVATITFVLSRVLPSSPAELMLGGRPTLEQIAVAEAQLGLDRPLSVQYVRYVADLLRGDLGISLRSGRPVLTEVINRFAATFELTTLTICLVLLIGIPMGVVSGVRQNSWIDNLSRALAITGVALPSFMLAMGLQMLFHGELGWLPLQGRVDAIVMLDNPVRSLTRLYLVDAAVSGNWVALSSALSHLVLPVATLTFLLLATVVRIIRNTMVEVLREEYIRTPVAYGVPAAVVHYRYALKATLIPTLTVIGLTYGQLLGGTIVVEFIYDWPGLGGLLVSSIIDNDYPVTLGATMFLAALYLFINLVVDLLYFVVDPRLRAQ